MSPGSVATCGNARRAVFRREASSSRCSAVGYTSDEASPSHVFVGSGTYTVTLTVTDSNGSTTAAMQVKILYVAGMPQPEGDAYIGNVPIGFYVVDEVNHEVKICKSETEFIESFGELGNGDGQFNNPTGLTVSGGTNMLDRVEV